MKRELTAHILRACSQHLVCLPRAHHHPGSNHYVSGMDSPLCPLPPVAYEQNERQKKTRGGQGERYEKSHSDRIRLMLRCIEQNNHQDEVKSPSG